MLATFTITISPEVAIALVGLGLGFIAWLARISWTLSRLVTRNEARVTLTENRLAALVRRHAATRAEVIRHRAALAGAKQRLHVHDERLDGLEGVA